MILTICFVHTVQGQEEPPAGADSNWQLDLSGFLSATQTSFTNWQEGGVNTLGYSAEIKGKANRQSERWKHVHSLRLAFGQINQDELGTRKATDVIQYNFVLQNLGSMLLNPTAAVEFRTQFTTGRNYTKNPFKDGREPPVKVSDFMAPAYVTLALGFSYDPDGWFKTRLGFAGKRTIVNKTELATLYGLDPGMKSRNELGIESSSEAKVEIVENVTWLSKLGLFAAFNKLELPDARWENFLTMKINDWLNVRAEHISLYDRDVSTNVQYKQITSIGVSISFF